ncbi:hypothetical protein [Bacillus litorisediminis]|nr:hypothetical protein [Bacillus litorisediminis]
MQLTDGGGKVSPSEISYTTSPTGSIMIEENKTYINRTTVNLQITEDDVHGPLQVRFLSDLSVNLHS